MTLIESSSPSFGWRGQAHRVLLGRHCFHCTDATSFCVGTQRRTPSPKFTPSCDAQLCPCELLGVALPAGLPVTPRSFHQPHMRPPQTLDLFVVILQPLDLSDRLLFLRGEDFRGPFLKCWWPMSGELVSDQTVHWASLSPLGSLRQVTETGSHYSSVCSPTQSPGTMGRWKLVALHFAREKTRKLI